MGNRYWVWVVVRLGVGVAIVTWAASYLVPGSGEKEFQKTLEAMKEMREQGYQHRTAGGERPKLHESGSGQKKHAPQHRDDDDRGAEVGLREDEGGRRRYERK